MARRLLSDSIPLISPAEWQTGHDTSKSGWLLTLCFHVPETVS
jgi:hypothetical protein